MPWGPMFAGWDILPILVLQKVVEGSLLGMRQFLTTENTLKMMKNAVYFISKALSVLKIFKFLL